MADVNISYKGSPIATMDASGSKTLNTQGKYCEDNITIQYTDPEKPTQTKSVTPSESAQTVTPDSGKVLSSVSVDAIPSNYVGTGVTRKAAATYTPTTTDQTIAASQYLTGAQTVKGDANLVAANIKEGVSIFGVQGTHSGGTPVDGYGQGGEVEPDEYEYTHAEDWTSDSTGNANTVYSAYCNSGFGVYFFTFFGNDTSGYYAKEAIYIKIPPALIGGAGKIYAPGRFVRYAGLSGASQAITSVSFYIKSGTVIKVERYPVFKVLGYE